jgi:D-xylose reductase
MKFADVPYRETWEAMEALHAAGKAKHIGVSNLNVQSLLDVLRYAKVKPACNQIENHVLLTQTKLVQFCQDMGIAVVAFSPLGAISYIGIGLAQPEEDSLKHPTVLAIAKAKGKTAAQVLLRFQLERGVAVVPKSQRPERLRENLDLGGFKLEPAEVEQLLALNCDRRFNDPAVYAKGWGEPGSWLAKHGYPLYA